MNIVNEDEKKDLEFFQAQLDLQIKEWTGRNNWQTDPDVILPEELAGRAKYDREQKKAKEVLRKRRELEQAAQEAANVQNNDDDDDDDDESDQESNSSHDDGPPLTLAEVKKRALLTAQKVSAGALPLPLPSESKPKAKVDSDSDDVGEEESEYDSEDGDDHAWGVGGVTVTAQSSSKVDNLESKIGEWEDVAPENSIWQKNDVRLITLDGSDDSDFDSDGGDYDSEEDPDNYLAFEEGCLGDGYASSSSAAASSKCAHQEECANESSYYDYNAMQAMMYPYMVQQNMMQNMMNPFGAYNPMMQQQMYNNASAQFGFSAFQNQQQQDEAERETSFTNSRGSASALDTASNVQGVSPETALKMRKLRQRHAEIWSPPCP